MSLAHESPVLRGVLRLEHAKIGTVGDPRLGKGLLCGWLAPDGPGTGSGKTSARNICPPDPLDAVPFFFGSYDHFLRWEEGRRQVWPWEDGVPCLSLLCIGREVRLRPNETFAPNPQIVFAFEKRCFGDEVSSRDGWRKHLDHTGDECWEERNWGGRAGCRCCVP